MVQAGNLITKWGTGGSLKGGCLLCEEEESEFHLSLKCPETQRRRRENLNNKCPHSNEEITLGNLLTTSLNEES
jgi:hypothetical protein